MGCCGPKKAQLYTITQPRQPQSPQMAHHTADLKPLPLANLLVNEPQHQRLSPEMARILASRLLKEFLICQEVKRMLQTVAYSSQKAANLVASIVNDLSGLEKQEEPAVKDAVFRLFTEDKVQQIKSEKIFQQGLEEELLKNLNGKILSQSSLSMIYHTIANIKKAQKINIKETNEFGITWIKSNEYKELSVAEMDQVVKYQTIGEDILKLGGKISFQFQSIKKESQNINIMLTDCFNQEYSLILSTLKYDLSEQEVMAVAKISREGCKAYDNGVYLLLVYLVKAVGKLQTCGDSSKVIQSKLVKAIQLISDKYPPGKGLQQGQKHLETALKNLVNSGDWTKVEFNHQIQKLKPEGKQKQVEEIITKYARIAQDNKGAFEELVKATCLKKGLFFKIGLKYYPDKPNPKALTRIKEKMFFGKEQSSQKDLTGSIKQVLEREEQGYRLKLDQLLEKREDVQFKISDMVRGKCVFLKVEEIIETVNEIKRFVKKDSRFGIKEIESRFTNPLPISDVTLKIVVNKQIVAELQLTVQTNAAAYNFAHKIYELQRTKVFSKLKITHNYFEESQQEFKELASTALRLMDTGLQAKINQVQRARAHSYFDLGSTQLQSFEKVLEDTLEHKKGGIALSSPAFDAHLQDLMLPLLSIQMGEWDKSIGRLINNVLQNQGHSAKLKGVLLSFFFRKFDIFKQSQRMQQFCLTEQQEKAGKRYMEEYLRQHFGIDKAFEYGSQTHRVFHRGQQLLQLRFWKNYNKYYSPPIQIGANTFVEGCVEEHTADKVCVLKEFMNFFFTVREGDDDRFYPEFQCYYKWLQDIIKKKPQLDSDGMIINEAKVLEAQRCLQSSKIKEAESVLNTAVKAFREKEQYGETLNCELLLAECFIRGQTSLALQDRIRANQNIKERAKVLGLQLKGVLVASSKWRMAQNLLQQYKEGKQRKLVLETIASEALTQLSRSRVRHFVLAMKQIWAEYAMNKLRQPQILQQPEVTDVSLIKVKLQAVGCEHLSRVDWKNLTSLNLWGNSIGAVGCEHLCKADWKKITTLILGSNTIGDGGCEHLSRAQWRNLISLNLENNQIGDGGCAHLSRADWKNLTSLNLGCNKIGYGGSQHLSRSDWKYLTSLNLWANQIRDRGCEYLSRADWKNLASLNLWANSIGDRGCEHLSKAGWNNLTSLNLKSNSVSASNQNSLFGMFKQRSLTIDF